MTRARLWILQPTFLERDVAYLFSRRNRKLIKDENSERMERRTEFIFWYVFGCVKDNRLIGSS